MSRKVYVHVGPRKTATSAIQRFLSAHDDSVVLYPKSVLGEPGKHHGHHAMVFAYFGDKRAIGPGKPNIREIFEAVGRETRTSSRDIVISSEILESRDVVAFIRDLLPHVGCSVSDVEVVVACREHFSRAASWYNHRLRSRTTFERRAPDKFLLRTGIEVCYAPLLRRLQQSEFRTTALNYHPSQGWVKRFLMHVGFPANRIPEIGQELVSQSPKITVAWLAVKSVVRSADEQYQLMRAFAAMPASRVQSQFIFGAEAAACAERHFAVDRAFLRDQFGIVLEPPDLKSTPNALFISEQDFAEMAAIAEQSGEAGRAIVKVASRYVRARS